AVVVTGGGSYLLPFPPNTMKRAVFLLLALTAPLGAVDRPVIDPSTPKGDPATGIQWVDRRPLGGEGQGWTDVKAPSDRLPAKAEKTARPPVWGLSRQSAGLCVRFATDATTLHARWTVTGKNLAMPHMPATGVSGLDLYVKTAAG